jgi:hypothetical protein
VHGLLLRLIVWTDCSRRRAAPGTGERGSVATAAPLGQSRSARRRQRRRLGVIDRPGAIKARTKAGRQYETEGGVRSSADSVRLLHHPVDTLTRRTRERFPDSWTSLLTPSWPARRGDGARAAASSLLRSRARLRLRGEMPSAGPIGDKR